MFAFFKRTKPAQKTTRLRNLSRKPHLELLEDRTVPSGFVDSFEGPTLNPFWTPFFQSGQITLSTVQAHSGGQAVQFTSTQTSQDKNVALVHDFGAPTFGTFSVWVYDSGAGVPSSNYIGMALYDTINKSGNTEIRTQDFDGGPGNGGVYYADAGSASGLIDTGAIRSQAWHNFVITTSPRGTSFAIDGAQVYFNPIVIRANEVELHMTGPSWRPAFVTYFDDFEFTPAELPGISMTSAQLLPENTVRFTYQTTGNPEPFQVGLYLSVDGKTYDPADRIGSLQTVAPGPTNAPTSGTLALPDDFKSDSAKPYLLVVADPNNVIAESNESNNMASIHLPVGPSSGSGSGGGHGSGSAMSSGSGSGRGLASASSSSSGSRLAAVSLGIGHGSGSASHSGSASASSKGSRNHLASPPPAGTGTGRELGYASGLGRHATAGDRFRSPDSTPA